LREAKVSSKHESAGDTVSTSRAPPARKAGLSNHGKTESLQARPRTLILLLLLLLFWWAKPVLLLLLLLLLATVLPPEVLSSRTKWAKAANERRMNFVSSWRAAAFSARAAGVVAKCVQSACKVRAKCMQSACKVGAK
jgi:hypothetical protein